MPQATGCLHRKLTHGIKGILNVWQTEKPTAVPYDKSGKIPTIRVSICTGEQVTGFKDPVSGKFEKLMLIRDNRDLSEFLYQYQVAESEIKREW